MVICALILLETSALYKLFTYLVTYLLIHVICNKLLQIIAYMVLAIISASLAAVLFSVAVPGIFVGRGDEYPPSVSHCNL